MAAIEVEHVLEHCQFLAPLLLVLVWLSYMLAEPNSEFILM